MTEEELYYQGLRLLATGNLEQLHQVLKDIFKIFTLKEKEKALFGLPILPGVRVERLTLEDARLTLQSCLTLLFTKIQSKQRYTIQQSCWNYLLETPRFNPSHQPPFSRIKVGMLLDVLVYVEEYVALRKDIRWNPQGLQALALIMLRLTNRSKELPSLTHLSLGVEILAQVVHGTPQDVLTSGGIRVPKSNVSLAVAFFGTKN